MTVKTLHVISVRETRNQIYLSDILITDGAAMIEPTFLKTVGSSYFSGFV